MRISRDIVAFKMPFGKEVCEELERFPEDIGLILRHEGIKQASLARQINEIPQVIYDWYRRGRLPRDLSSFRTIQLWANHIREEEAKNAKAI